MDLTAKQIRALGILLKDRHAEELQAKPLNVLTDLVMLGLAARKEDSAWDGRKVAPSWITTLTERGVSVATHFHDRHTAP